MSITREQARRAIAEHGTVRKAALALHCRMGRVTEALRGEAATPDATPAPVKPAARKGRSLAEFRQAYDKDTIIPQRIRAALRELGPSGWDYEVAFAKLAGISLADLGAYRPAYEQYVVVIRRDGKRAWAGSTGLAGQMKEMVG